MRCVNETLPPRERARWLLITTRLSASSFAGTARTLVAVGTVSEAFMFLTTAPAAPRSGIDVPSPPAAGAGRAAAFEVLPALGFSVLVDAAFAVPLVPRPAGGVISSRSATR